MSIDTSREAVERLLDGVTPGPWLASEHQWPDQVGCCPLVGRPFSAHKDMRNVAAANTKADIHFIAAARDLVPALLAERDDYADQLGELVPTLNREAVEQRARAEAAEAREQALLTSYDEERKALVENASLRERLKDAETERDDMATLWQQAEMGLASALAERDAALAEVARLSTPPDDAEVAELVAELGEPLVIIEGYSADYVDTDDVRERMGKAADALTRLSHAHAAEKDKREGMEHALYALTKACEGEPSEVFAGEIGGALTHAHATLAAHAARREE